MYYSSNILSETTQNPSAPIKLGSIENDVKLRGGRGSNFCE